MEQPLLILSFTREKHTANSLASFVANILIKLA